MEKIYAGILVARIGKVTDGLIDDEQRSFRAGRECVDEIINLKQISEKQQEKKIQNVCGFYGNGEEI